MRTYLRSFLGRIVGLTIMAACTSVAHAETAPPDYGFAEAAQEITQLFWLAETANVCGWASEEDTQKFKHFSVRFLSAHLSGNYKVALVSLVTENDYANKLRRVANEGAPHNCGNARWQNGWTAYKAAADQRDQEF